MALSSGKIDKYECLAGEEILPSDQSRIIEQVYILSTQQNIWEANNNNWKTSKKQNKLKL